jgi:hypothetical protein
MPVGDGFDRQLRTGRRADETEVDGATTYEPSGCVDHVCLGHDADNSLRELIRADIGLVVDDRRDDTRCHRLRRQTLR